MSNNRDAVSRDKIMGKLSTKQRKNLPAKDFAGPDRSFPVNDPSHARAALSRVANRSPELKKKVREKVAKKYPGISQKDVPKRGKKKSTGKRASGKR